MRARNFIVALLLFSWLPVAAAADWQTCHLDGYRDALRCTRVAVPRDYADPAAGEIEIHVAVAPAVRARAEPDPLFVLAGGPGQAGSDVVSLLDSAFAKVRASRDIVFVDQRGTGRSGHLGCDIGDEALVLGDSEVHAKMLACLRGFGTGLLAYTTDAAAQDLERVRVALDAASVNLWGGSYGSRLAQAYATRYPGQVRSLILDGVVDADLIIGAGSGNFETALDALLARCTGDAACQQAFPSLRQQLQTVLARLDAGAVTQTLPHPRGGAPLTVPVSRQRLLGMIKYLLYSPAGSAQLPYLIARAAADDWRPLLAMQANGVDLAAVPLAFGLLTNIGCREDWPRLDAAGRAQQIAAPTFGTDLAAFDALCRDLALPPLPSAAAGNLDAPGLLLSGALDPVTPPALAERVLRRLPHGQHLVAAKAGHIVSGQGCAPKLLRRFLDAPTQPLDGACLAEIALPPFQTSAAGTAP